MTMTLYLNGVDANRDQNKDDIYALLQNVNTLAVRGGSGGAYTKDAVRIAAPAALTGVLADGTWQAIADLSVVEENINALTVATASATITTAGWYIMGVDVDVTQTVLNDPELAVRFNVNAGVITYEEDITVYEVSVLQNSVSRTCLWLEAGDVVTVDYKASLDDLDINYIALYLQLFA